jgi:hypothetical protein
MLPGRRSGPLIAIPGHDVQGQASMLLDDETGGAGTQRKRDITDAE